MLAGGSPVPASDRRQHTGDLVFGCAPAASLPGGAPFHADRQ